MTSPLTFPALRKGMHLRASHDTRRTVVFVSESFVLLKDGIGYVYQMSPVKFERHGFEKCQDLRSLFPIGCRVTLSAEGERTLGLKSAAAKVVGYSRDGRCIRIIRDGCKSIDNYWHGFWKSVQTQEGKQ